ncbi:MAG: hypothetical protein M0R02_07625 [Bacteroidales bacterium]|jgi:hypothetical protein|nr:hypothetical protein [Bacteroidales bacterium]HPY81831.1 hypothetical protein [Bacteroidales bacterium]
MATIELSSAQLNHLLELVYLGEWMRQAYTTDTYNVELEDLEQKLYAIAYNEGLDESVEYDKKLGGYVPSEELEASCDEYIDVYDDQTFWEELIIRMAQNKLEMHTEVMPGTKEYEKLQETYITEFGNEFKEHGLERVKIQK